MSVPTIRFHDGYEIPQLGYGVWQISDIDTPSAIVSAINIGYRSIDTAKLYNNENGVGRAIKQSEIPRKQLFITTKLASDDQGYDATLRAFDESMKRLQLDQLDLYLIHWPSPSRDLYVDSWKALIRLKEEQRIKSIGVCNFRIVDLERLINETGIKPVLNQIELHPYFQQKELRIYHQKHDIATQAWSPLGRGALFNEPALKTIAQAHGRSVAQIILRWHMEVGNIAIPKSANPQRMKENFDIFSFSLTAADHDTITALDQSGGRIGPDPNIF